MRMLRHFTVLALSSSLLAACGGGDGGGGGPGLGAPADPQPPLDGVAVALVTDGLTAPVALVPVPDDSGRLFVVDQAGTIHILTAEGERLAEPFLDVTDRMVSLSENFDERGLLGLAFHPEYADNGRFFVYYSAPPRDQAPPSWDHTSHISEFAVAADNPDRADPDSERIVLQVDQPQNNHNAGTLLFGPDDGFLYVSLGDGGGGGDVGLGHTDELGNAQDVSNLLGSIVRIDVDGTTPYAIPPDNPFAGSTDAREEIFAYGLRNPYRMAFDRAGDHALLAADAGQLLWEAVYLIEPGGNFGWNIREGSHCFDPDMPSVAPPECEDVGAAGEPLIDPVIEYPNIRQDDGIGLVVIGGHVYRGSAFPGLDGHYVFGDWSTGFGVGDGVLLIADTGDDAPWRIDELELPERTGGRLGHYLLGFGEDHDGELYVLTSDNLGPTGDTGRVYRLTPLD